MLKNYIFHEPVIPRDALLHLASCVKIKLPFVIKIFILWCVLVVHTD